MREEEKDGEKEGRREKGEERECVQTFVGLRERRVNMNCLLVFLNSRVYVLLCPE